jgi:hypothetical protein
VNTLNRYALVAVLSAFSLPIGACGKGASQDRWVTTHNTNVDINWDAVGEAYKTAEGPEDFEKKVNEIYEGDEIISVAVRDESEKTQVVTGFIDNDENGQVGETEKIFEIKRDLIDESRGSMQLQGYGHYAGYHSPMWDIASGMVLGSMMSRMFTPSYVPMYTQPYVTPVARRQALTTHRSSYRAANPQRFQSKSQSGRTYNNKGSAFGGRAPARSRSFGGRRRR